MRHLLSWITNPGPATDKPVAVGLLALRLHLGLTMAINAGLGKVAEFPAAPWFVEQVAGMGFPAAAAFAFLAAWGEVLGGLLLAAGLFTRFAAGQLCIQMGVAAFIYHGVFPVVDLHITHVLFWTFGCLTLLGGGRYSLDSILHRRIDVVVASVRAGASTLAMPVCLSLFMAGCGGVGPGLTPVPAEGPFAALAGEWTGTLEYADFSDESRSRLPITVTVTPRGNGSVARLDLAVSEPSGRVEGWSEDHRVDVGNRVYQSEGPVHGLEVYRWDPQARQGKLVWVGEEIENGINEPVRGTVTWDGNSLILLKETRSPLQFRNSLRLVRSEPSSSEPSNGEAFTYTHIRSTPAALRQSAK